MTFITKSSGNGGFCCGTQNKTSQGDCNGYQRPPSRKKSDCHSNRSSSHQGCIQLDVDKCKLVLKTKSTGGSRSNICDPQSHGVKRSPNGSSTALCGSQPLCKPKQSYGMPSSCCASHAQKLKKSPSGSSSNKYCATRKSSKQSMRGKSCTKTGENWCDCRNLPTKKISCEKKVCVPSEGQYVRDEWWCDCRDATKYTGKKLCIRPVPIIPKGNLRVPDTALESDTTYKTDYTGKYGPPREPIRQEGTMHANFGPMSSLTTHKVDYTPKPHSKRDPINPPGSSLGASGPMEGESTTMHDYQAPRGFMPAKSFRPIQACRPNLDPMQDETTHKHDYVDWHTRGPQGPFPWTPGNKFMYPTIPMVGDTTYKTDYTNNGMGDKRLPIIPKGQGLGIFGNKFDGCTTYKHDYVPWECVNEQDYSAPQGFINCYRMEGQTPEDPDKKLWCYKTEDVCPYYPPKAIEGTIPGTTQYVVRPSEEIQPCVEPKPSFGCQNENSYAKPEVRDCNYSAAQPCGYSGEQTKQNYNADVCVVTNFDRPPRYSCGPDNYDYSINQHCRPTKVETNNFNHETNQVCRTKEYNNSACQPCGSQKTETKQYNYNSEQICATTNYNSPSNQPCGPDNYNYSLDQHCRPSKKDKTDYNQDPNQVCGTKGIHQPCGSAREEAKDCTNKSYQTCGYTAQEPKTYAPFEECCNKRQEAKLPQVASHSDPCCGTATQYKPKETCENPPSKPYYSIGQKYDQNCACMSQPTSRFTTQQERVLTVHC